MQLVEELAFSDTDADALVREAETIVHDAFVRVRVGTRVEVSTAVGPHHHRPGGAGNIEAARPMAGRDRSSVTPWARSPPTRPSRTR